MTANWIGTGLVPHDRSSGRMFQGGRYLERYLISKFPGCDSGCLLGINRSQYLFVSICMCTEAGSGVSFVVAYVYRTLSVRIY